MMHLRECSSKRPKNFDLLRDWSPTKRVCTIWRIYRAIYRAILSHDNIHDIIVRYIARYIARYPIDIVQIISSDIESLNCRIFRSYLYRTISRYRAISFSPSGNIGKPWKCFSNGVLVRVSMGSTMWSLQNHGATRVNKPRNIDLALCIKRWHHIHINVRSRFNHGNTPGI